MAAPSSYQPEAADAREKIAPHVGEPLLFRGFGVEAAARVLGLHSLVDDLDDPQQEVPVPSAGSSNCTNGAFGSTPPVLASFFALAKSAHVVIGEAQRQAEVRLQHVLAGRPHHIRDDSSGV